MTSSIPTSNEWIKKMMMHATNPIVIRILVVVLTLLFFTTSAAEARDKFGIDVDCPSNISVGQNVPATITLESFECFVTTARIITSVVGNSSDTFGGIGVFGPVVANPMVSVPAAVDSNPPFCFFPNQTGTTSFPILSVPTIDASLAGTVTSVIFAAEFSTGAGTKVVLDACLVQVDP